MELYPANQTYSIISSKREYLSLLPLDDYSVFVSFRKILFHPLRNTAKNNLSKQKTWNVQKNFSIQFCTWDRGTVPLAPLCSFISSGTFLQQYTTFLNSARQRNICNVIFLRNFAISINNCFFVISRFGSFKNTI